MGGIEFERWFWEVELGVLFAAEELEASGEVGLELGGFAFGVEVGIETGEEFGIETVGLTNEAS